MLTNIAVLRTVKENANKAVLDALPSILFEGSHNSKDSQKYYLQGPAAEYVPVNIPDETAKKFPSAPRHWLCSLSSSATRQKVSLDLR